MSVFSGFTLADGRRGGICWDEKPRCVEPHHLKTRDVVLAEGIVRCRHQERRASSPCGAQLYVSQLTHGGSPKARGEGERIWIVVEVTREHIERMKREPMIFIERMIVLGVALPGVETDILGVLDPGRPPEE